MVYFGQLMVGIWMLPSSKPTAYPERRLPFLPVAYTLIKLDLLGCCCREVSTAGFNCQVVMLPYGPQNVYTCPFSARNNGLILFFETHARRLMQGSGRDPNCEWSVVVCSQTQTRRRVLCTSSLLESGLHRLMYRVLKFASFRFKHVVIDTTKR
jgi:hypothetical protein